MKWKVAAATALLWPPVALAMATGVYDVSFNVDNVGPGDLAHFRTTLRPVALSASTMLVSVCTDGITLDGIVQGHERCSRAILDLSDTCRGEFSGTLWETADGATGRPIVIHWFVCRLP